MNQDRQHLHRLPPNQRRLLIGARLNLPRLVTFITRNGEKVKVCKACYETVEEHWQHILWDCKAVPQQKRWAAELYRRGDTLTLCPLFDTERAEKIAELLEEVEKISKLKEKPTREVRPS